MAGTLGSLIVDIGADVARLQRDMGRAQRTVSSAVGRIRRVASIATRALGGIGAGLAAGFSTDAIRRAISDVAELADVSSKLGIGVERLQELQYAASQYGISQQTANLALQRFVRRTAEAANNQGELSKTLQQYGVSVVDANGAMRDSEEILGDLAEVIKNAGSDAEALRIAFKAFDSEGAAFVNVLRRGRDGLELLGKEAREAGAIIDQAVVKSAKELDDRFTQLTATISTKFKAAVVGAADALNKLFDPKIPFAYGKELEKNRERVKELADQIAQLDKENQEKPFLVRRNIDSGRVRRLKSELAELQAVDPDLIIGEFNQRIAKALRSASTVTGEAAEAARANVQRLIDQRNAFIESVRKANESLSEKETEPPPPIPESSKKALEDFDAQARETIATLEKQRATLGFTAEQMVQYEARVDAAKVKNAELAKQLVDTADAYATASKAFQEQEELAAEAEALRYSLRTPFDEAFDALERYDLLLEKNLITMDEWAKATNRALDEATEEMDKLEGETEKTGSTMEDVFRDVGSSIERSITDAVLSAQLSLESLGDLAQSILESIARQIIQTMIVSPITSAIIGSFGGGKQAGGPVRGGSTYLVGERGPELFTPGANGHITPNHQLAGAGGMTIHNHFTFNSPLRDAAEVMAINRDVIIGVTRESFNRQGQQVKLG